MDPPGRVGRGLLVCGGDDWWGALEFLETGAWRGGDRGHGGGIVTLNFYDHQSAHPVELPLIEAAAAAALPGVLGCAGTEESALEGLEEIEITFVDDEAITQVHADFLDDATPTDVITFHHGEILISTETAARQAEAHGQPLQRELALYVIHGLLHLHGHTDLTEPERGVMHAAQDRLLASVWPEKS